MSTRYISDLHAFEPCIFDWVGNRFTSVAEYAEYITYNWNGVTQDDDLVIVDGDLGLLCPESIEFYRRLSGIKILVLGNHDAEWAESRVTKEIFYSVLTHINTEHSIITHRPEDLELYGRKPGMYAIHGHHHSYSQESMQASFKAYAQDTLRLNCCASLNGFKPCTLPELIMNKEILIYEQ